MEWKIRVGDRSSPLRLPREGRRRHQSWPISWLWLGKETQGEQPRYPNPPKLETPSMPAIIPRLVWVGSSWLDPEMTNHFWIWCLSWNPFKTETRSPSDSLQNVFLKVKWKQSGTSTNTTQNSGNLEVDSFQEIHHDHLFEGHPRLINGPMVRMGEFGRDELLQVPNLPSFVPPASSRDAAGSLVRHGKPLSEVH